MALQCRAYPFVHTPLKCDSEFRQHPNGYRYRKSLFIAPWQSFYLIGTDRRG
jgi:hypothetical protein